RGITLSHSTGSARTSDPHSDAETSSGVPVTPESASQEEYSDSGEVISEGEAEDDWEEIHGHYGPVDDIDPSDSASRPRTTRVSSHRVAHTHAHHDYEAHPPPRRHKSSHRVRPEVPPPPPPDPHAHRAPRQRRERPHPRPESYHEDTLDHDDYPYPGGYGRAPGWAHVPPSHPGGYPASSASFNPFAGPGADAMVPAYGRDPYYGAPSGFAPTGANPFGGHEYYDDPPPPRQRRPPPRASRHSMYGRPEEQPLQLYNAGGPYYPPHWGMSYPPPHGYPQYPPYPQEPRERTPPSKRSTPAPEAPPPPAMPVSVPMPPPPPPGPDPVAEKFEQLQKLIEAQTAFQQAKEAAKRKALEDEKLAAKEQEEKTQSEKLAALEKLLLKQNEEAIAREKAAEAKQKAAEASAVAKLAKEAAEKAASDKIAKELAEAADKAKKAAEEEAAKKAAEAKEAHEKEMAA
ncbi:hypothetical protein LTS18_012406, partial [Coniosporium uncinatum]